MDIFKSFPCFPISADTVDYNCGDGAFMRIFSSCTQEMFFNYKNELEKSGFVVLQRHDIAGNIHFTLKKGSLTVQYYFNPCSETVRLIADLNTHSVQTEYVPVKKVCDTQFIQFETDHSLIDCGMCYIIKCADNSFFVIDSAHFYSIKDNDRIHDFLRSMTPAGEKIRISGWFITHGHDDHVCKVKDYLKYNMADTVIDCFYMNIIPTDHRDNHFWGEANKAFSDSFCQTVREKGIPVVKLHTGQRFFVRNLEFEVLCTHEDVYPCVFSDYNNSSTVLMLKAEGQKILIPGDASDKSSVVLEKRYGDYLKCDIIQLSHHGHHGTSEKFYEYASAPVVLCPNTQIKIDEEMHIPANIKAFEIAEEVYISANGTVKLTLPYVLGTAEVLPDETNEDFNGIKQLWNYEYTEEFKKQHIEKFIERGGKL